jgi:NADH-quinone oxidoreductase subunit B
MAPEAGRKVADVRTPVTISVRPDDRRQPGRSLRLTLPDGATVDVRFLNAGLACCAVEVAAALESLPSAARGPTAERSVTAEPSAPPSFTVLVVSGTVTDKLAPAVLAAYREIPAPRRVLSYGACSNSGGPYWDSYSVTKGVDQLMPVDVYVPGCPPRPEALLDGLLLLAGSR